MKKVILKIGGMSCSACSNRVEKYLNKQNGVRASVNLVMAQALIEYDEDSVTLDDLNRYIKESGYTSLGVYDEKEEAKKDNSKYYLIAYAFLIVILMYISMSHMIGLPVIPYLHMLDYPINYVVCLFLLTILFLIYGFDIIKSGIIKLIHLSPNMDSLVTIGVLSSFIYSVVNLVLIILGNSMLVENLYFESAAMIIYFIKLGRFIDKKSKEKTKEAIKELVQITPKSAFVKKNGEIVEVTIDEVNVGDILVCRPGQRYAVDGVIVSGSSHVDESFITGESKQARKQVGDNVVAGSINIDGVVEYEAKKIGYDSTISEIVRLVVEASNTKAPIARLADIVSSYFVPGIMVIAILTFIFYLVFGSSFNDAIISFVTVLVVACPCALGLATPLAIVVSEGYAARNGILIKKSEILENAKKIDTVVFDKTGTLTYGKLKVSNIRNYSNYSDDELLSIVASLEANSTHPIAKAFADIKDIYDINEFNNLEGCGVRGKINDKDFYVGNNKLFGMLDIKNNYSSAERELSNLCNSIIYVIEDSNVLGIIGVSDVVRDNASEVINKLKNIGKDVIMLSGDNEITANIIGKNLGIDKVIANVMPQEKRKVLDELIKNNHKVMMVGDGINDAPSLATSNIGVSMNGGTDIAADSADVILMNDDLSKVVELILLSKRVVRIIKQNLFLAFFYNSCMVPIAIGILKPFGIVLSPMMASIAMTISSLTVVFNSLRLRKWRR